MNIIDKLIYNPRRENTFYRLHRENVISYRDYCYIKCLIILLIEKSDSFIIEERIVHFSILFQN